MPVDDYDESLGYLDFVDFNKVSQSNSHKGFFISGNIDATYQHWNVWGLDFGPWLSIAVTNVHHRAHGDVIGQVKEEEEVSHDIKKMIGSANRRAVETILGVAASYDLTSNGILTFNLGYKHDFRRLKGGDAELLSSNEKEVIKYDLKNVRSGRDSFVAKADIICNSVNSDCLLEVMDKLVIILKILQVPLRLPIHSNYLEINVKKGGVIRSFLLHEISAKKLCTILNS